MGIYYFNIRDELGMIEDPDGIELPDRVALLMEVIRSAEEFLSEATMPYDMRFEIADGEGRTVLVTPVKESSATWNSLAELSRASGNLH